MRSIYLTAILVGLALPGAAHAQRPAARVLRGEPDKEAARRAFETGQRLFQEGRYQEAVQAFSQAQRLAPHPSVLFNIARCHESMGNTGKAIEAYEEALRLTTSEVEQKGLRARLAQLRASPVKVFISSRPSGARVTIDGRARPEPQPTPLIVQLKPGEHVLIVEREGYQLATRRLLVEVEKEQPVEVALQPLPPPCPPPCPACPPVPSCPSCQLAEFDGLHIHLAVLATLAVTKGRALAGGPGIYALASYRRWIFGGHFAYLPFEEVAAREPGYTRVLPRWIIGELEFGRVFPFTSFFTYATGGIGIAAHRSNFSGEGVQAMVREYVAFSWSIGGGIEAMATRWLSFGLSARFGMNHGERPLVELNTKERGAFPYGTVAGIVSFHL